VMLKKFADNRWHYFSNRIQVKLFNLCN